MKQEPRDPLHEVIEKVVTLYAWSGVIWERIRAGDPYALMCEAMRHARFETRRLDAHDLGFTSTDHAKHVWLCQPVVGLA